MDPTVEQLALAAELQAMADRLQYRSWDVANNLRWDAEDLEQGIQPGEAGSWRLLFPPFEGRQ